MAQSYTRQSTITDGNTITAALFNNEYNQLVNAFTYSTSAGSTGHRHDGTAGHGGNIHTVGDLDFFNKIVADSTNNRWGFFVQVSSGAVEQIRIWAKRLNLHLTANEKSADPASVAYDGVSSGIKRDDDHIIVDTSGRVYTNINLMQELQKIYRTVNKLTNSVDVLITIDANTGQNGILQVREFLNIIPLSGVILTKMDGTARGGIAVQIMQELKMPIYYIGVGEKTDDLIPFDLASYIKGLTAIEIGMENG